MRTVLSIVFVMISLAAVPASAAEMTKLQCYDLIREAIFVKDAKFGLEVLNSKTAQDCFKRFPDLNEKYFPVRFNEPGLSRDPAFTVKWK